MFSFRAGETPPDWCELRHFRIYKASFGETLTLSRTAQKERVLVSDGRWQVTTPTESQVLRAGQFFDFPADVTACTVAPSTPQAELVHLSGTWGAEIAGCGIWTMENEPGATNGGDPVDYPKNTRMDSHYHDYDEYWVILDGDVTAVVDGIRKNASTGDCVIIPAGCHHDLPDVQRKMRSVFFETTLIGEKRLGHLWEHTHGPAQRAPHATP